jgi:hypothetical protein
LEETAAVKSRASAAPREVSPSTFVLALAALSLALTAYLAG